ncbi:MAG TPA: FHA domain-containing protein [Gammaproteobacteria bacterium]|nr:FHA domain-containing protein [Gammaproteobacteria bacterium]
MNKNKNKDIEVSGRALDITELPTGEYPALSEGDGNTAELPALAQPETQPVAGEKAAADAEKASFWLAHLESEVTRLHAKWQTIDAEFKSREARAAELQQEIAAREATIAQLNADLQRDAASLEAAGERLAGKDAELAALTEDRRARDERIAALATELADAEVNRKAALAKIVLAEAETARLNDVLAKERGMAADLADQNAQLTVEQHRLNGKLQDLEAYINGRHDSWSTLNAKLAEYKDALAGMEKTVQARDAEHSRLDDEKRGLSAKILELERQCSELAGRRKEREEAYDELQQRLAAHFAQMEQLKTEHAGRIKELDHAAGAALGNQRQIEALQGDIKGRDARIATLEGEVQHAKGVIAELTTANGELTQRVGALDQGLVDRSLDLHALREELRKTREQLTALEGHAAELGRLRAEAVAVSAERDRELTAQKDLVANLTADLRAKKAATELLERSVGRITDLGASLAALDKEMQSGDDEPQRDGQQPSAGNGGRKLVTTIGGEAIQYPIFKNVMTIGRGHESDIRIPSHFVSRIHAKISTNGMATIIEDAGSKNGLVVNSERVQRHVLHHGDVVNIGGELNLKFVDAMH